jgi:hypothetical protein
MRGLLLFVSLAIVHFSFSQMNSNAYSNMLSGAQTNHPSSLSLFYNPSLQAKQTEIGVGSTLLYPSTGLYDLQLAYSLKKKRSTLGIGVCQNGYAQYNQTTALLQYALQLDTTWTIGVTTGVQSSNYQFNQTYTPQFAIGLAKYVTPQIQLSVNLFNQQKTEYKNESAKQINHTTWEFGFAYHSISDQFSAYFSTKYEKKIILALALYYRISPKIHFFVSGKSSPNTYSFGGKFKTDSFAFLIGFHYDSNFGFSPSTVAEYAF